MKLLKKIINKIINKFNVPKMDISDKEYDENLKKLHDRLDKSRGEAFVVPLANDEQLKLLEEEIKKYIKVSGKDD